MKFLLTIYSDESQWADATPQDLEDMMSDYEAFTREATQAGVMLGGEGLAPSGTATTVRVRGDDVLTSDGPFAETREQLGGFYLLECPDLDAALGWAAKVPDLGEGGAVEVRPVMDYEAAGSIASIRASPGSSGTSRRSRRKRSIALLRAVVAIQPAGLAGTPSRGQRSTATRNASCTASSARSRSPNARARTATACPDSRRNRRSIAAPGALSSARPRRPAGRSRRPRSP